MNLLLLIATIFISFIIVRIGAIAFQLTGLEWSTAKFQSLSCFSGTGFTTREAELIVVHPQRRRIATILMILGNAGLVAMIATFANTLNPNSFLDRVRLPFLPAFIPPIILPWINLIIIVIFLYYTYRLFTNAAFTRKLTNRLREYIINKKIIKTVSFEELLLVSSGYGISQIEIGKNSPLLNKTLIESNLRQHDITVLLIERQGKAIPNPKADTNILAGDQLYCFGRLGKMREKICGIG